MNMRSLPTTTSLDSSWHRRSAPWPPLGALVAVCWQMYRDGVCVFVHSTARLVHTHEDSDGYVASTWQEADGSGLFASAPDFWKPVEPHNPQWFADLPQNSPEAKSG